MRNLFRVVSILIIVSIIISGCSFFGDDTDLEENGDPSTEEGIKTDNGEMINDIETTGLNMRETIFYYVNDDGNIVPHVMSIPWEEGIARAAVNNLIDSDEVRARISDSGLSPVLPKGTEILGLTIRDGLAKIDFNCNFINFSSKKEEENAVSAVIYTLTEFPTVDMVQFMIEGENIETLLFGTNISGVFDRDDVN